MTNDKIRSNDGIRRPEGALTGWGSCKNNVGYWGTFTPPVRTKPLRASGRRAFPLPSLSAAILVGALNTYPVGRVRVGLFEKRLLSVT